MLLLLILFTASGVLLVPPIIDEFYKLKELLTAYFIEESKQAAIPGTIANFIKENVDMLQIQDMLNEENLTKAAQNILPKAWNIFTQSVNVIASILATFIILLLMVSS